MYVFLVTVFMLLWAIQKFGVEKANSANRKDLILEPLTDFKDYVWPSIAIGFLSSQWRDEFLKSAQLWRAQVWDYRRFLFSNLQLVFSYAPLLLALMLSLQVNSFIVMTIGVFTWLLTGSKSIQKKRWSTMLGAFIYFSLILFFLEVSFKNSGLLMQFFMDTGIVFITTVDSNLNLFVLLTASVAMGIIFPVQGWSVVVTYLLYLNSQLSFLGMVFVLVGELIGLIIYWMHKTRNWDLYYRKKSKGFILWSLGYLIGFLALNYGVSYFVRFGGTYNQLMYLKWIFLTTVFALLLGWYLTLMVWGHFTIANLEREVIVSDSALVTDLGRDVFSEHIVSQLKLRRAKLAEFRTELQADPQSRAKIPPFVLNQFEAELSVIDKVVPVS